MVDVWHIEDVRYRASNSHSRMTLKGRLPVPSNVSCAGCNVVTKLRHDRAELTGRSRCTVAIQLVRLRGSLSNGISLIPFARNQLLAFTPFGDFMYTFYILVNFVASVIKNDALPLSILSLR